MGSVTGESALRFPAVVCSLLPVAGGAQDGTRTSYQTDAGSPQAPRRAQGVGPVHYRGLSAREQDRRRDSPAIRARVDAGTERGARTLDHERQANARIRRLQGM